MSTAHVQEYSEKIPEKSLLDYINRVRIENAKQLLRGQEIRLDAISALIGYNSAHTFIRVFKKYEGITPGGYREMLQEAAEDIEDVGPADIA